MSDASVGSIIGYLKLDRSDWDAELNAAGAKADELGRRNPNIAIKTNAPSAIAQLAAVSAAVKRLQDAQGAENVAQAKLTDLQNKGNASASQLAAADERLQKAHRAVAAATIGLANAHDQNDQAMLKATSATNTSADSANKATFAYRLWADTIALVLPALVPIAGATAGAAIGLTGLAATAAAVLKGVQNEIANNTQMGQQFSTGLGVMSSDLQSLEHVAAGGVLTGFTSSVGTLHGLMTSLTPTVALLSTQLGGIASHSAAGFSSIMKDLAPLITAVGSGIEQASAKFQTWAAHTTGVSSFVAYAENELPTVMHFLSDLTVIVGHVLQAMAPMGGVALGAFGVLAHLIAAIPVGVLRDVIPLATDAYIAFRVFQGLNVVSATLAGLVTKFGILGYSTVQTAAEATAAASRIVAAEDAAAVSVATDLATQARARLTAAEVASSAAQAAVTADDQVSVAAATAAAASVTAAEEQVAAADTVAAAAVRQASVSEGAAVRSATAARTEATAVVASGERASAGWLGMLGPVGAVVVGAGLLASVFMSTSRQQQQLTQDTNDWTSALVQSKGAIDDTVRASVAKKLSDDGVLKSADALGLPLANVTQAVLGQKSAYSQLAAQLAPVIAKGDQVAQISANQSVANRKNADSIGYTTQHLTAQQQAELDAGNAARSLLDTIKKKTGAYKDSTKAQQEMAAAEKQATQATSDMTAAQLKAYYAQNISTSTLAQLAMTYGLTTAQAQAYAQMTGILSTDIANGNVTVGQMNDAIGKVAGAYNTATTAGSAFLSALSTFSTSAGTAADHASLLGAGLVAMQGDALGFGGAMASAVDANRQLTISFQQQTKDVVMGVKSYRDTEKAAIDLKTGMIDTAKSGAGPLIQQLQAMQSAAEKAAESLYQHEAASKGLGQASKDAANIFKTDTYDALMKDAGALGLTKGQAKKLADQYFNMPKDFTTIAHLLGTGDVVNVLNGIGTQLSFLTGHPWVSTVVAKTAQAARDLATLKAQLDAVTQQQYTINVHTVMTGASNATVNMSARSTNGTTTTVRAQAAGGTVGGSSGPTADDQLTWLSTGEEVINAKQAKKHRGLLKAINAGIDGFASGGTVGGVTSTGSGKNRVWHFGGQQYSTLAAARNAEQRVDVRVTGTDTKGLYSSLNGSASQISAAMATLFGDTAKLGGSRSLTNRLKADNTILQTEANRRASIATRLTAAQTVLNNAVQKYNTDRSAVAGAVTGTFNISSAGAAGTASTGIASGVAGVSTSVTSGGVGVASIISQITQAATNAHQFYAVLWRLSRKGLSKVLLDQLAQAGPNALPQALALDKATSGQLQGINAQESSLVANANAAGKFMAGQMDGAGVQAALGLVNGLKSQDRALAAAMRHLANVMVAQIKTSLRIHSPSLVMHELGQFAGKGFANGIGSQTLHVRSQSLRLASAAVPPITGPSAPGGDSGALQLVQHIYPQPGQSELAIAKAAASEQVWALRR